MRWKGLIMKCSHVLMMVVLTSFTFVCGYEKSTPVSVVTKLLNQSENSISVNVEIENTGSEALTDLEYVYHMTWSDHSADLETHLDWSNVSNVSVTIVERQDYIAEIRYDMGSYSLAPGEKVFLNTRYNVENYGSVNFINDPSYAGVVSDSALAENPNVVVYSEDQVLYGILASAPFPPEAPQTVEVHTTLSQQSTNTLGLYAEVKNVSDVPVNNVSFDYFLNLAGDPALIVEVDYTDLGSLTHDVSPGFGETGVLTFNLGEEKIAAGQSKMIQFRIHSSDWSDVNWADDYSYQGIVSAGVNESIVSLVNGVIVHGIGPDHYDGNANGIPDIVEDKIAGSDLSQAESYVLASQDRYYESSVGNTIVSYDFSSLNDYDESAKVYVEYADSIVDGVLPVVGTVSIDDPLVPIIDHAYRPSGKVFWVEGDITGAVDFGLPIPAGKQYGKDWVVLHNRAGAWEKAEVNRIEENKVYFKTTSFSPFVLAVRQKPAIGVSHLCDVFPATYQGKELNSTLIEGDGGSVWCLGDDQYGQLGNGLGISSENGITLRFSQVFKDDGSPLTNITDVQAGENFTIALDDIGNVWGWGTSSNGQLGVDSDLVEEAVMVYSGATKPAVQIAAINKTIAVLFENQGEKGIQFFGELQSSMPAELAAIEAGTENLPFSSFVLGVNWDYAGDFLQISSYVELDGVYFSHIEGGYETFLLSTAVEGKEIFHVTKIDGTTSVEDYDFKYPLVYVAGKNSSGELLNTISDFGVALILADSRLCYGQEDCHGAMVSLTNDHGGDLSRFIVPGYGRYWGYQAYSPRIAGRDVIEQRWWPRSLSHFWWGAGSAFGMSSDAVDHRANIVYETTGHNYIHQMRMTEGAGGVESDMVISRDYSIEDAPNDILLATGENIEGEIGTSLCPAQNLNSLTSALQYFKSIHFLEDQIECVSDENCGKMMPFFLPVCMNENQQVFANNVSMKYRNSAFYQGTDLYYLGSMTNSIYPVKLTEAMPTLEMVDFEEGMDVYGLEFELYFKPSNENRIMSQTFTFSDYGEKEIIVSAESNRGQIEKTVSVNLRPADELSVFKLNKPLNKEIVNSFPIAIEGNASSASGVPSVVLYITDNSSNEVFTFEPEIIDDNWQLFYAPTNSEGFATNSYQVSAVYYMDDDLKGSETRMVYFQETGINNVSLSKNVIQSGTDALEITYELTKDVQSVEFSLHRVSHDLDGSYIESDAAGSPLRWTSTEAAHITAGVHSYTIPKQEFEKHGEPYTGVYSLHIQAVPVVAAGQESYLANYTSFVPGLPDAEFTVNIDGDLVNTSVGSISVQSDNWVVGAPTAFFSDGTRQEMLVGVSDVLLARSDVNIREVYTGYKNTGPAEEDDFISFGQQYQPYLAEAKLGEGFIWINRPIIQSVQFSNTKTMAGHFQLPKLKFIVDYTVDGVQTPVNVNIKCLRCGDVPDVSLSQVSGEQEIELVPASGFPQDYGVISEEGVMMIEAVVDGVIVDRSLLIFQG